MIINTKGWGLAGKGYTQGISGVCTDLFPHFLSDFFHIREEV